MGDKKILMEKKSKSMQCFWHIGKAINSLADASTFVIQGRPGDYSSFKILKEVLNKLIGLVDTGQKDKITSLLQQIETHIPNMAQKKTGKEKSTFFANAVTYAIMRRISRESVYTSSIIDTGAKLINELFSELGFRKIQLFGAQYCDRLSLKVFTRAILLDGRVDVKWDWFFDCDIKVRQKDPSSFIKCRQLFFGKLEFLLKPEIIRLETTEEWKMEPVPAVYDVFIVSSELVLQNYDNCILLCDSLIQSKDFELVSEGFRLKGLALVNIGCHNEASETIARAEELSVSNYRKAHLAYLQGLIAAKRIYSLLESDLNHNRGLQYLENDTSVEASLERAWLFNGIAMNEVLKVKKGLKSQNEGYDAAYQLLTKAFGLVSEGEGPARQYLRFNLLANLAFLYEIRGNYDVALKMFNQIFDLDLYQTSSDKKGWNITLKYRTGLLFFKSKMWTEALENFSDIYNSLKDVSDKWAMTEKILRAYGFILLHCGASKQAIGVFRQGLQIAIDERSAVALMYHASGLLKALSLNNEYNEIEDLKKKWIVEGFFSPEELLDIEPDCSSLSFPSPKLPAYIPEIDLEDTPTIDLNQTLGTPQEVNAKVL